MANWAYVENGEVIEKYDILPDNWKNISNFFALKNDVEYLKNFNWFPITRPQYEYDPTIQQLDNARYKFVGTEVIEEFDIVPIPKDPLPTIAEIEKMLIANTKERLDRFAQSKGYDDITSACSYAMDNNIRFKNEGSYCVKIRSETWTKLFQIMDDIRSEKRVMPNSFTEVEFELPLLIWPE